EHVRIPPAQIDGHQADAGFDEAAGQEDALTPSRRPAAVGRARIERRHEAVALADVHRLGIEIEGVARGPARENLPRLLAVAIQRLHLAAAVDIAANRVEPV